MIANIRDNIQTGGCEKSREFILSNEIPTTRIEAWRYTNVSKFISKIDQSNANSSEETNISFTPLTMEFEYLPYIGKMNSQLDSNFFYHLSNTANSNVVVISETSKNILKLKQSSSKNAHNIYIIKKHVSVDIMEEFLAQDAESTFNITHSFYLEENSQANFIQITDKDSNKSLINNVRAYVERNSSFESIVVSMGCKLVRNNISVMLAGENSESSVHGVYKLNDSSHFDTNSYIEHASPRSYSNQLYKGIMDDRSHGIFTGLIKVNRDSQEINSNQLNKNLILSKKARSNSMPQLEIFADDVKCAHGSTTGQLADDQLFYFQARGIPEEKAREILADAFINDVLLKIKNKEIQTYITDKFAKTRESNV